MKLKSLLSASLMLAALAGAGRAQEGAVLSREGDAFRGRVESVRVERVQYRRVGAVLVEGARRLVSVSAYTPDGKRREQESYAPGGAVYRRVSVYDDAGNEIEHTFSDGKGKVESRYVRLPSEGERLVYNGDGSLREHRVVTRGPDGGVEQRLYDGEGALRERWETKRVGGVSVVKVYGPDGVLKRSTENVPGAVPGLRHSVQQSYNPDGTVYGRRASDFATDASAMEMRVDNANGHGREPKKTRETREFDSRKNPSRIMRYVWNETANDYELAEVVYYTATYYR